MSAFTGNINSSGSTGYGPTDYTISISFTLTLSVDTEGYLQGYGTATGTISGTTYLAGYPGVVLSTFDEQFIQPAVDSPNEGFVPFVQGDTYTFNFSNATGLPDDFESVQFVGQFNADDTELIGNWIVDDNSLGGTVTIPGMLSAGTLTLPPLFTTGDDLVDFNNLEAGQVLAISNGADLYHGLGGSDFVDLPDVANYAAIGWNPSATFYTGSLAGDSYFVTAGNGNYNVQLGAGSDGVIIDGNGDSTITAGYGDGDVSSEGTGVTTIDLQPAPGGGVVTLTGQGDVQTVDGLLTKIALGLGEQLGDGLGSSAEVNDPGSNALVGINGGELILDQPTSFNGLIGYLTGTDSIDLKGVTLAGQPILVSGGSGLDSNGYGPDALLEVPVTVNGVTQLLFLNLSMNGVPTTASGDLELAFSAKADGSGGVLITDKTTTDPAPTVLELAQISQDAYSLSPTSLPLGFTLDSSLSATFAKLTGGGTVSLTNGILTDGALEVVVYSNADQSQIIIAVRGTDTGTVSNALSNLETDLATFPTGSPSPDMQELVSDTAHVLQYVASQRSSATITLTGHSLGGAAAELVSKASGYNAVVFNAPGGGTIYAALNSDGALTPAKGISSAPPSGTTQIDYRDIGDAVSLIGTPIGLAATIVPNSLGYSDATTSFLTNHSIQTLINNLSQPAWNAFETGTQLDDGVFEPNSALSTVIPSIVQATSAVGSALSSAFEKYSFSFGGSTVPLILDPSAGTEAYFTLTPGSPALTSLSFFADPSVDHYLVWSLANGAWSAAQSVTAGEAATFGAGVDDVRWEGVSASGSAVPDGSATLFEATFASTAAVNATLTVESGVAAAPNDFNADGLSDFLVENTSGAVVVGEDVAGSAYYTQVSSLGPEWSFEGTGNFLGDGNIDFLIKNTAGSVYVGEVAAGSASYTAVASLGPEWSFKETGDFLGHADGQFLIENTAGAVDVGEVVNGQAAYTLVADLGSEWTFVGAGDFLAEGHDQFLIQNTAGDVFVGDVVNGAAVYTGLVGLGSEWKFVGTGDFLSDGKDGFLIENTSGDVFVGEVSNGGAVFTGIVGLGLEWKFLGTGDYLGEGHDQFLIQNAAGQIDIGDYAGGAIHFTAVAALDTEWAFH